MTEVPGGQGSPRSEGINGIVSPLSITHWSGDHSQTAEPAEGPVKGSANSAFSAVNRSTLLDFPPTSATIMPGNVMNLVYTTVCRAGLESLLLG